MSDVTPDPEPFDPPSVHCRHLLVGRGFWYDPDKPDEGFSLRRIVVDVRSPDGSGDPFVEPRLFAYFELFGTPGEYDMRVMLAEVTAEESDGADRHVKEWGPWPVEVTGMELVEQRVVALSRVPFDNPGVYEFRLLADGFDEPLAAGQVRVLEFLQEPP